MVVHQKGPAVFVTEAEKNADTEYLNTETSELESESDDDEIKLSEPRENAIYNRDGLLDKLGDISWPENVEWIHKLSLDINEEQEVDANDDLTRELAFNTQALEGTREAFLKFQSMGRPFLRPSDYNAAMVKNDTHLEKVNVQLLAEKKRIEEAEERKKTRESEKIAKEVEAQKLKERAKQEKDVKKWRKERQQSGVSGPAEDGDVGLGFEGKSTSEKSNNKRPLPEVSPGDGSGGKAVHGTGKGKKEADKKRRNRDYRDSKYAYGGKKGMKKQTKAETTNDIRGGFNNRGFPKNKRRKT